MKLTVFQSDKGDCLLLTGADGRKILADGGMRASYTRHVAPALGKLRDEGVAIDVVYVSHTDQDHISGVLQMMNDEVAWRIYEYAQANGNPHQNPPTAVRPPEVKAIWHNAFHEVQKKNAGAIEEMLAASAAILSGATNASVREQAVTQGELATSIAEAIQLSRRIGGEQLGIPLNAPAKGKLMMVRDSPASAIKVGGMRLSIIGPFAVDLRIYRKKWNEWLAANKERVKSIQKRADEDASRFGAREIADIMLPKLAEAEELSRLRLPELTTAQFKLGQREEVTEANLASLMFFVKEGAQTLLLTGDGHHLDIIKGLQHIKKLNGAGGLHVNVLKVQHHGSEHNLDEKFCRTVTADHYVFCGNGEHENPDLRVIKAIADSRLSSDPAVRSGNQQAGDPFKFWFNSSEQATEQDEAKAHMRKVESLVRKSAKGSGGQMAFFFLKGSSFELQL